MFKCKNNNVQVHGGKEEISLNNSCAERINHDHRLESNDDENSTYQNSWCGAKTMSKCEYICCNLDSILKTRDIPSPTKVCIVKAIVFLVVMYRCGSWTIKKVKHQRIDAFELCWRRPLRVPWTARRSNQPILKKINCEYSLEGLMPKLKLQYFDHLMWRADSLEKMLMLGKIEGKGRRVW